MSAGGILKLLIDTNVWMDYFSGRSDRTANVVHLIEIADASELIALFASSLSVKDVSCSIPLCSGIITMTLRTILYWVSPIASTSITS